MFEDSLLFLNTYRSRKTSTQKISWIRCSRFDTTVACDRQTDRRRQLIPSALAQRRAGKTDITQKKRLTTNERSIVRTKSVLWKAMSLRWEAFPSTVPGTFSGGGGAGLAHLLNTLLPAAKCCVIPRRRTLDLAIRSSEREPFVARRCIAVQLGGRRPAHCD